MSWQPNENDLIQGIQLLQALRDPLRPDHVLALKALDQYVLQASFILHILHIFTHGNQYPTLGITADIRQLAGFIIKNYVFPNLLTLPEDIQTIVKNELMYILNDPIKDLRKTSAILLGKISELFHISFWGNILPYLITQLEYKIQPDGSIPNPSQYALLDGCLFAIQRICEDSSMKLSQDTSNAPLDQLIPRLLQLLSTLPNIPSGASVSNASPTNVQDQFHLDLVNMKLRIFEIYNALLYLLENPTSVMVNGLRSRNTSQDSSGGMLSLESNSPKLTHSPKTTAAASLASLTSPLILHMHTYIAYLGEYSRHVYTPIRRAICQSITIIACLHIALLEPYFASISSFMLVALEDNEETVAIEACEYWNALLQQSDTKRAMLPYLQQVIHILIGRLYLTKEQLQLERQEEAEEAENPTIRHHFSGHNNALGSGGSRESGDDDDADNHDGSGGNSNTDNSKWTLRKQAALTLDIIAMSYPAHDILTLALPKIQACFTSSEDVFVKESGMLAIGALSNGCADAMAYFLPQLFPFFLTNLSDPLPEIRSISCWVLSRYCRLFGEHPQTQEEEGSVSAFTAKQGAEYYLQTFYALLQTMHDTTPKVQIATCSALCLLIENSFAIAPSSLIDLAQMPNTDPKSVNASTEEVNLLLQGDHVIRLLQTIHGVFDAYTLKSRLLLVDIVGTLADTLSEAFRGTFGPEIHALYLHKIGHLFFTTLEEDSDARLIPVLECFTSLGAVLGPDLGTDLVVQLYHRCIRILYSTFSLDRVCQGGVQQDAFIAWILQSARGSNSGPSYANSPNPSPSYPNNPNSYPGIDLSEVNLDIVICCLDVLSSLQEGLHGQFYDLVQQTHSAFILVSVVFIALKQPFYLSSALGNGSTHSNTSSISSGCSFFSPELMQSAFSLTGELCKYSLAFFCTPPVSQISLPHHLQVDGSGEEGLVSVAVLQVLLEVSIEGLQVEYPLVCNNAAWTIGELAIQLPHQPVLSPMTRILTTVTAQGNVMYAVGRSNCSAPRSMTLLGPVLQPPAPGTTSPPCHLIEVMRWYIPKILHELILALQGGELRDQLKVNIAVTLGRLASLYVFEVSELADDFFADWCSVLSFPCPVIEKQQAFYGLLTVLHEHIEVLFGNKTNMYAFFTACNSWVEMYGGGGLVEESVQPVLQGISQVLAVLMTQDGVLFSRVLRTFSNSYPVEPLFAFYHLTLPNA